MWHYLQIKKIIEKVSIEIAKNAGEFKNLFNDCIMHIHENIAGCEISDLIWIDNEEKLRTFSKKEHNEDDWISFWEMLFVQSVNKRLNNFKELNDYLIGYGKHIIFILDGLEETLQNTNADKSQQNAISTLCQKVIRDIGLRYSNLGAIAFIRKDLARDSIHVNYEQFNQLYSSVELKWSRNEALRLALWLVMKANPGFYEEDVSIENASADIIEKELQKLWGIKLGKPSSNEAYSSRWILAALSDFNGQLQARDIIRFLQFATDSVGKLVYEDRIIMPADIKSAVPKCSLKKIEEIKSEIGALKPILQKFEKSNVEKILPFEAKTFNLSATEEKIMIDEGYLIIEDGKYYLPEILRHSLKFKYGKGARPKVLSLMKN